MNTYKLLLHDKLIVFLMMGVWAIIIFSGCQQPVPKEEVIRPVFFPKPPDKPLLQFLKSFSGPEDVGAKGPSVWERGDNDIGIGSSVNTTILKESIRRNKV